MWIFKNLCANIRGQQKAKNFHFILHIDRCNKINTITKNKWHMRSEQGWSQGGGGASGAIPPPGPHKKHLNLYLLQPPTYFIFG